MTEPSDRYRPFPQFLEWRGDVDESVVSDYVGMLQDARSGTTPEQLERAVRVATRYAAVDTGALEGLYTVDRGFTKTIATEAAAWEVALKQRGDSVERSIHDALNGYDYVLDAVTGHAPITEVWIRTLHEILCQSQEEYTVYTSQGPQRQALTRGGYKALPNSPTNVSTGRVHHYAPPEDTPAEMSRLVEQLRSTAFLNAHPVTQAAYAHYAFVCVHPFADGNGRVARALASVFLYRNPGVPLLIFADQRDAYIDSLEAADRGDQQRFTRFIQQRALDAIDLVTSQLSAVKSAAARQELTHVSEARDGLTHAEVDAVAGRLIDVLAGTIQTQLGDLDASSPVKGRMDRASHRAVLGAPPPGYRTPTQDAAWTVHLSMDSPIVVTVGDTLGVWVALPDHRGPDMLITRGRGSTPLRVNIRDLHPTLTQVLDIKLDAWVEGELGKLLEQLSSDYRAVLGRAGYLSSEGQL